jgi:hypothetical protein
MSKLRAHLLVTFDDQWGEEGVNGQLPVQRCQMCGADPASTIRAAINHSFKKLKTGSGRVNETCQLSGIINYS